MNYWCSFILINFYQNIVFAGEHKKDDPIVFITSSSNVKYIKVPFHDDPILIWIEARKGKYPNITNDPHSVAKVIVGEPVTIFVFFKDPSNLHKLKVTDCWAYDNQIVAHSKQKLHLYGSSFKSGKMADWKEGILKGVCFLSSSFVSFKFPDKDKVFLSCDVELFGQE